MTIMYWISGFDASLAASKQIWHGTLDLGRLLCSTESHSSSIMLLLIKSGPYPENSSATFLNSVESQWKSSWRGHLYLSGEGDEDRNNDLLRLQDGFSKAHKEVLIQNNLVFCSWWIQTTRFVTQERRRLNVSCEQRFFQKHSERFWTYH